MLLRDAISAEQAPVSLATREVLDRYTSSAAHTDTCPNKRERLANLTADQVSVLPAYVPEMKQV
jgi:hypothetical protein